MMTAFVIFGGSLILAGIQTFVPANLPIIAFGLFMLLAGVFGHKPITPGIPYQPTIHTIHSMLASTAGICITLAFIWKSFDGDSIGFRLSSAFLAILCIVLPLLMMLFPNVQGLIQRLMYACVFAWLWFFYP
jgi:hypothetical protein